MRRVVAAFGITCVAAGLILTGLAAASTAQHSATTVRVIMGPGFGVAKYFRVLPSVAKAGPVTFVASNRTNLPSTDGGVTTTYASELQFVALRTNLAHDKLKIRKSGTDRTVVLTGLVGKPISIPPGKSSKVTLNLKPGKYVLLDPKYYEYGMHAAITVIG